MLLYNYSSATAEGLHKAEEQANAIFQEVGVEVIWVENTVLDSGPDAPTLKEMDVILRVLSQPRASLPSRTALGEALPCGSGREGCIASVFFDRVKRMADRTGISVYQVLGHAMAHELGHLLLGSNSHSGRGLMRASWNNQDAQRAAKGDLLFTSKEAEAIAQKVSARIQERESLQNLASQR
ncbi:MAG: hypothetical protein AB1898_22735 [Acidobacteriota bacterium]